MIVRAQLLNQPKYIHIVAQDKNLQCKPVLSLYIHIHAHAQIHPDTNTNTPNTIARAQLLNQPTHVHVTPKDKNLQSELVGLILYVCTHSPTRDTHTHTNTHTHTHTNTQTMIIRAQLLNQPTHVQGQRELV